MRTPRLGAPTLDRHTTMGHLSENVRLLLKRGIYVILGVLAAGTAYLTISAKPGAVAFGLISAGAMIGLAAWSTKAIGVPLMPMIVGQQLVINGLPLVTQHEIVSAYPEETVFRAGLEVFSFCCSLTASWIIGMQVMSPARAEAYTLEGVDREGAAGLTRLGFGLAGGATAFLVLQSLGFANIVLDLLPAGSYPVVLATVAAASACGFFLSSMIVGSGEMKPLPRMLFWTLMGANCLISASSLLLSSALVVIASVVIGLFWSSGRIPWRFFLVTAVAVSFFNTGKYAMRTRYWQGDEDEAPKAFSLTELPQFYMEWTEAGFNAFVGGKDEGFAAFSKKDPAKRSEQTLFDRLNNLQNLLYVVDAVESGGITPLGGETYAIIPPLLIPRVFWKDKPRTHEGQVRLNVHFGRQLLESTVKTYVAWGLLAEAYGNFGMIKGTVLLGLVLGMFFAWAENFTAKKPLLSVEGFVAFAIFLGLANSYEAVASVMVTAIFQSLIPVIGASLPFARRMTMVRPDAE